MDNDRATEIKGRVKSLFFLGMIAISIAITVITTTESYLRNIPFYTVFPFAICVLLFFLAVYVLPDQDYLWSWFYALSGLANLLGGFMFQKIPFLQALVKVNIGLYLSVSALDYFQTV